MSKAKNWDVHTIGRRKTSIARVYMSKGSGKISVNGREMTEYFPKATSQYIVTQPLNLLNVANKYDIKINVVGGGITGQAGAVRHAISRGLIKIDTTTRGELKKAGFLTRDPRAVERKKPGKSGARKRYQFSKR